VNDLGLGIIGLGYMGTLHLKHSLKLLRADHIAVADLSRRALTRARQAGVKKSYTDYERLLRDPSIDAVIIALPTHLHLRSAVQAAEAKKHILLEKPIATNVEEATKIISAARRNSVKLMVGYHLRFNEIFSKQRQLIRNGTLGDVEVASSVFVSSGPFRHRDEGQIPVPVPDWWFKKDLTGGGVLMDLGVHLINLLRWYFGEITNIRSHLRHRFNLDFEDGAICLVKFASGTTGVINVGWFSQEYRLNVELCGTGGYSNSLTLNATPNILSARVHAFATGLAKFHYPHFAELQYFVDCLTHDRPPSPSGEDAQKDLEAISLAYKNEINLA
jgi:predicted dehydrogenase